MVICEKEDRTNEYKQIITNELHSEYEHFGTNYTRNVDTDNYDFTMYEFLKFKGLNTLDSREIIDSIKVRCLEMFKSSENYTEILSTIEEDWDNEWDSSDSEDVSQEKE